jgi:hypothetical protein
VVGTPGWQVSDTHCRLTQVLQSSVHPCISARSRELPDCRPAWLECERANEDCLSAGRGCRRAIRDCPRAAPDEHAQSGIVGV